MNRSKVSLFLTNFYVKSTPTRQLSCSPILYQRHFHEKNQNKSSARALGTLTAATSIAGGLWYIFKRKNVVYAKEHSKNEVDIFTRTGSRLEGLPQYRKNEVCKTMLFSRVFSKCNFLFSSHKVNTHDTDDKRIWVTFKNGVYDITDFVSKHPGAKNILMAAGGSIEPFWNLYAVHQKVCYHIF